MADEQVAQLYATLEVIAKTDSVEEMESALEQLDKQVGGVTKGINEQRQALAEYEEWTKAVTVALDALGISAEEWAQQLERNEEAVKAARAEQEKLGAEMAKDAEAAAKSGGAWGKLGDVMGAVAKGSIKDVIGALMELPAWFGVVYKAITFCIGAMNDLGAKAEHLANKSLSTGMTTDAVQGMEALAKVSGVASQSIFAAITRMQVAADKGSKAFQQLGMSSGEFARLSGDQQLEVAAKKIFELETATERARLATDLFGRGMAQQLMPVLKELAENGAPANVGLTAEQIEIMAAYDDEVDKLGVAWGNFYDQIVATVAVPLAGWFSGIAGGLTSFLNGLTAIKREEGTLKMLGMLVAAISSGGNPAAMAQIAIAGSIKPEKGGKPKVGEFGKENGSGFFAEPAQIGIPALPSDSEKEKEAQDRRKKDAEISRANAEAKKAENEAIREAERTLQLHVAALEKDKAAYDKAVEASKPFWESIKLIESQIENGYIPSATEADHVTMNLASRLADDLMKGATGSMVTTEMLTAKLLAMGLSTEQVNTILAEHAKQLAKNAEAAKPAYTAVDRLKQSFALLASGMAELAGIMFGGDIGGMVGQIGDAYGRYGDEMDRVNKMPTGTKAEQAAKSQAKLNANVSMGAGVASALGNVLAKSTNPSVAKLGGALQGAAAGAKMGAAFGPWGAAVGAAAGAVMGFINKAKQMKKEMDELKKKFLESNGGLEQLQKTAMQAGINIDKALNAKSPAEMKKAMEAAQKQLDAYNKLVEKHGGTIDAVIAKAKRAKVDMTDLWNAKNPEEYLAAVEAIGKELDTFDEAFAKGNEIMERWGLTVEQMGPKFAQLKLDDMAKEFVEAFQFVTLMGGDVVGLLDKMNEEIGVYLDSSLRAGAEIPQSMKPVIDKLWETGQLIHENGKAYTEEEYNAIKYAKTTNEMFDEMIKKITELVNALLGIPTEREINIHTNYSSSGDSGGGGGGGRRNPGPDDGDVPMAEGGLITRPTRILAGEAGAEAIIPLSGGGIPGSISKADMDSMIGKQTRELAKVFRDAVLQARG